MGKWNEAIFLVTKDGTGFCCVDGVIGAVTRKVAFDLHSQMPVEIQVRTGDKSWINGLIEVVIDVAVDWMNIAIASIKINAREFRRWRTGSLNSLSQSG